MWAATSTPRLGTGKRSLPVASGEQVKLVRERLDRARQTLQFRRAGLPKRADCQWFVVRRGDRDRKVRTLSGEEAWLDGVEPAKVEIELAARVEPESDADTLLKSENNVLVSRATFDVPRNRNTTPSPTTRRPTTAS